MTHTTPRSPLTALRTLALLAALVGGCDGTTTTDTGTKDAGTDTDATDTDATDTNPETDLETAFCDLLANGQEVDVEATLMRTAAPEAAVEDKKVEITLVDNGGMFGGFVAYTPDEAGSFALGLGEDVPIKVVDSMGTVVPFDAEIAGASCSELAVRYTVSLELETYYIEFGPTDTDEVDLVSEESDDDL